MDRRDFLKMAGSTAVAGSMNVHLEHGAIPTVTLGSARDILSPNATVKDMLDRARG